jgi:putative aminopeptidase FrvX
MYFPSDARFYLDTLREIVSIPTTSYHEQAIGRAIRVFLDRYAIPYEVDRYGNIIAHYRKGAPCRPLALMAHTDHPAFELEAAGSFENYPEANWSARLLGGVMPDYFKQPSGVRVFVGNDLSRSIPATLLGGVRLGGPRDFRLFLKIEEGGQELQPGHFGIWDLPDFELRDGFIHARVLDDLVGCVAAMLTLWKLVRDGVETDVYGVFTRAEEVGLVGAEMVFQQKLLPEDTFVVSLEASRTLPGAIQGEGPVVRVGDRAFTFSEEAEFVLKQAGKNLQQRSEDGPVKVQRQLMSGGRCEASTAILMGYTATGLAFPLDNYHNMGKNNRIEAENIHQDDFLTGVELLQEAAILMPKLAELYAAQWASEATAQPLIDRLIETREG